MKKLVLLASVLLSLTAFADDRPTVAGPHNVYATLGFGEGQFDISGGYEYMMDSSLGAGGHLRIFPKNDDGKWSLNPGLTIVGADLGYHFFKRNWDLSFTPGINVIVIDHIANHGDNVTTLGPSLSMGILHQLNSMWAIGFDYSQYYVWFSSDYAGKIADDLSFKARVTF